MQRRAAKDARVQFEEEQLSRVQGAGTGSCWGVPADELFSEESGEEEQQEEERYRENWENKVALINRHLMGSTTHITHIMGWIFQPP